MRLHENAHTLRQVDEPALREGLPLKRERWDSYLDWAVRSFRLATVVARPETQVCPSLTSALILKLQSSF